jgi:hypothetical protein
MGSTLEGEAYELTEYMEGGLIRETSFRNRSIKNWKRR